MDLARHSSFGASGRGLLGAAALAAAVAIMTMASAQAAGNDPVVESISFDIDGFQDLLLVEETDRLFVTGGAADDTLLVLDLEGTEIARVTGLDGVRQMAYDRIESRVWVAMSGSAAVAAYDATSGAFQETVSLPGTCPSAMAAVGISDTDEFGQPIPGNESLIVSSECDDDTLTFIELSGPTVSSTSGFPGVIQLAPSPPPEQLSRFVLLDAAGIRVLSEGALDGDPVGEVALTATSLATSYAGSRRVAAGGGDQVSIWSYPSLEEPEADVTVFTGLTDVIALEWTSQPAVVAVLPDEVVGLKPSSSEPFWRFPIVGDPFPNGIQAHSDGRIYIVVQLPHDEDDPDEGGIGVIVPVEGDDPGSITGNVSLIAPAAPGENPVTLEARLFNDDYELVAADTVPFGTATFSFESVQPGSYHLEVWSLTGGTPTGFFPERYNADPLLSKAAVDVLEVGDAEAKTIDVALRPFFHDMFGSVFRSDIEWMGSTGVTKGCNPPLNTLYCPGALVTRGQMAAFLVRALGLPVGPSTDFIDDDASIFEADIEKLAAAGITKGCNPPENDRFCPGAFVTRGQMAAFLVRALGLPVGPSTDFIDDDGSVFEADIEKLAAAGITKGCNPPENDRFCPSAPVTRGQMAAFLNRALGPTWPG